MFEDKRRLPEVGAFEKLQQEALERERALQQYVEAVERERQRRQEAEALLKAMQQKIRQAEGEIEALSERISSIEAEAKTQRDAAVRHAVEAVKRDAAEQREKAVAEARRQRMDELRLAEEQAKIKAEERRKAEAAEAERQRVAAARAAEERAKAEAEKRRKEEAAEAERQRVAAARAAEERALREAGIRDLAEAEALAEGARQRLQREKMLADRLASALTDQRQSRSRAVNEGAKAGATPSDQPPNWLDEERTRIEIEQRLRSAAMEAPVNPIGQTIRLRLKGSAFEISGVLKSFDQKEYVIAPPNSGDVSVPVDRFDCIGDVCPTLPN